MPPTPPRFRRGAHLTPGPLPPLLPSGGPFNPGAPYPPCSPLGDPYNAYVMFSPPPLFPPGGPFNPEGYPPFAKPSLTNFFRILAKADSMKITPPKNKQTAKTEGFSLGKYFQKLLM